MGDRVARCLTQRTGAHGTGKLHDVTCQRLAGEDEGGICRVVR